MNPTDCKSNHYSLQTAIAITNQHNSLIHTDTQSCSLQLLYHTIVLFHQVFRAATASRPMHASSSIVFRRTLQMWGLWSTYLWISGMVAGPYPGCMFQTNTSPPPFLLQSHCTKWIKQSCLERRCLSASPHEECHSNQVAIKTELWQSLTRMKVITEFWVECNIWLSNRCYLQWVEQSWICVRLVRQCVKSSKGQNSSRY